MVAERERMAPYLDAEPDKTVAFVAEMDMGGPEVGADGAVAYTCPMHPEVVSEEPGRCPDCGMKLLATAAPAAASYTCPMHPEVASEEPGRCPDCGMKLMPAHLVQPAVDHGGVEVTDHEAGADQHHGDGHGHETAQGIE